MNKNTETKNHPKRNRKNNKGIIIFVSVFLSMVLTLGIVLVSVMEARASRAVVEFDGLTMDMETVSYFASACKNDFMRMLSDSKVENVIDQPAFWKTVAEGGEKTYGELLSEYTELSIRRLMASVYLYDSYLTLSYGDRKAIENIAGSIVDVSEAYGDKKLFNKLASIYGFDYDALVKATEIMYKEATVKNHIYGTNGSNLKNFPDLCEEYLKEYTHVKLLYIRTESKYVYDQNGNRVVDQNNKYVTEALNETEKAERLSIIEEIRGFINANADAEMTPELFDTYLGKYDELDADMREDGYYFHKNSIFTKRYPSAHKGVIEKSYSMEIDTYDEIYIDGGVYFIYKYQPTSNIYTTTISEACFTDFYSNLANKLFVETLDEMGEFVVFKDAYLELDLITLPYNYKYRI